MDTNAISSPPFRQIWLRRVRSAAGSAMRMSLIILFACLISDYFFAGELGFDRPRWRNIVLNTFGALLIPLLVGETIDLRREERLKADPSPVFDRRWVDTLKATALMCVLLLIIYRLNPTGETNSPLIGLVALRSASLFAEVRPIRLTPDGISQALFGGRTTLLAWPEIEAITFDAHGNTSVIGPGGTIVHTRVHLAPEVFRATVSRLSGRSVSGPNGHIAQGTW